MMPASLRVLRCHDKRDCCSSRSSIRSQTQRSPSTSSATTSTRIGSDSAWKTSAARVESTADLVGMEATYQAFLIRQVFLIRYSAATRDEKGHPPAVACV